MVDVDPIDIGATFDFNSFTHRVTNIYIDEDGIAQVRVNRPNDKDDEETIDYPQFRQMMEDDIITRTNSAHDAWKWRQSDT